MSRDAVTLINVSKHYPLYTRQLLDRLKEILRPGVICHTDFTALKPLDLKISKGETVGILGRNGAGKSTLLKVIAGVKQPTSGTVEVDGSLVALLELGGGFNPDFTGLENIYFYCSMIGLSKREIERITPAVIEFSEIGSYIHQPLKLYSTGMRARLAFAVSVLVEPDILILDEVLSVGDILFQRKCFVKMEQFFKSGKTVLFVSHNVDSVKTLCQRSLLLHDGELLMDGPTELVIPEYHLLMFSSQQEQPEIVERIRSGKTGGRFTKGRSQDRNKISIKQTEQNEPLEPSHEEAKDYFVEGFESKSKSATAAMDIVIHGFYLERLQGGRVTHLARGNRYRLIFLVDFNESVKSVNFATWFYSERTHFISGIEVPDKYQLIEEIAEGVRYQVSVEFDCVFNPGLYGMRLVVRGERNQEYVPLSIVEDAIIFSVLEDGDNHSVGFVKIAHKLEACEVDRADTPETGGQQNNDNQQAGV